MYVIINWLLQYSQCKGRMVYDMRQVFVRFVKPIHSLQRMLSRMPQKTLFNCSLYVFVYFFEISCFTVTLSEVCYWCCDIWVKKACHRFIGCYICQFVAVHVLMSCQLDRNFCKKSYCFFPKRILMLIMGELKADQGQ